LLVVIDSIIVLSVGFMLKRLLLRATRNLETIATEAVISAAEDVRNELVKLLPKRPDVNESVRKAAPGVSALGGFLGLDMSPLAEYVERKG
jgi:hypothetical protein